MSVWNKVAIVGVGLLGGSVGLALRKRGLAKHIVGIDRDGEMLRIAQTRRAIDSSSLSLTRGAQGAELAVVCTPVERISDTVSELLACDAFRGWITDVGSTKRSIVDRLEGLADSDTSAQQSSRVDTARFVASHPLAGGEKSGPEAADADLFEGCTTVVVPLSSTLPRCRDEIIQFWQSLGATARVLDAPTHDRIMASVSHLPHVVASVLAAGTTPDECELAARGWRDTTRIAAGDPSLWAGILLDNRTSVLEAIDRFVDRLAEIREAIHNDDRQALFEILNQGKTQRDALGS